MPLLEDYLTWNYRQVDSKSYIEMYNLADGEILEGVKGPSLKIASEVTADKVDKIHAIALLYRGKAISSTRFITHHDSITALYMYLGANPLYARIQEYIVGFSTLDDWFCTPATYNYIGLLSQCGEDISRLIMHYDRMPDDSIPFNDIGVGGLINWHPKLKVETTDHE
jgi:hypothetical protein